MLCLRLSVVLLLTDGLNCRVIAREVPIHCLQTVEAEKTDVPERNIIVLITQVT
jgi:hypothetical protein